MTLESSKTLGGVGAILIIVGSLGSIGLGYAGLLSLIGIILVLIALKGLSDHYNEGGIFNNALYGLIVGIIGGVAFVATIVVMVLAVISTSFDWTSGAMYEQWFTDWDALWGVIGAIVMALIVLFVCGIIAAIFFRKSLSILSAKSGEKIFETAGLLWLIGAILTIVLVGLLLIWVAWILIAIGFFSIKTTTAQPPATVPPPPP
ncbi:hypothetical protein ES702_04646 [subsurface metagenome]